MFIIYSFWIEEEKLTSKLFKLVLRKLHLSYLFSFFVYYGRILALRVAREMVLRSVYKEILSIQSNVMSRAKWFNGNTFKI